MKRTVALGAAWTASAAAAVGLGFLAVSFVDASASPGTQPVAASTTSSTSSSSAASPSSDSETRGTLPSAPSPTTSPQMSTGEYVTRGGTVYAHCTSGSPVVAGVPAAGFWVDDSNDPGKVEFESGAQEVEVRVSCVDGSPIFRLDDSPSSASATSGRDDDDDNSGHGGSDDDSDDSSGHGGSDDD